MDSARARELPSPIVQSLFVHKLIKTRRQEDKKTTRQQDNKTTRQRQQYNKTKTSRQRQQDNKSNTTINQRLLRNLSYGLWGSRAIRHRIRRLRHFTAPLSRTTFLLFFLLALGFNMMQEFLAVDFLTDVVLEDIKSKVLIFWT